MIKNYENFAARVAKLADFLELNSLKIPYLRQCVPFRNLQKKFAKSLHPDAWGLAPFRLVTSSQNGRVMAQKIVQF